MNAINAFLAAYLQLRPSVADNMLAELSEAQIRTAPTPGVNTTAWLVWHIARTEDVVVNRFLVDGRQVLDDGDWPDRLGVATRQFGVAMTSDEVRRLSAEVDLAALRPYWDAVGARTEAVLRQLTPDDLDQTLAADHVRRVIRDEGIIPDAPWVHDWVEGLWPGKSKAFMMQYYALGHNLLHRGESLAIRGLFGKPGR